MGEKASERNIGNPKDEKGRTDSGRSQRGRRPKPIDLQAALELTLIGSSLREQARQAGCSGRTLMGHYAEIIELAEARVSAFLKLRLHHLALIEGNPQALLFLLRRIYETPKGPRAVTGKWSRGQLQQALRIVWRHTPSKPKLNYTPFRLKGRKNPQSRSRRPEPQS